MTFGFRLSILIVIHKIIWLGLLQCHRDYASEKRSAAGVYVEPRRQRRGPPEKKRSVNRGHRPIPNIAFYASSHVRRNAKPRKPAGSERAPKPASVGMQVEISEVSLAMSLRVPTVCSSSLGKSRLSLLSSFQPSLLVPTEKRQHHKKWGTPKRTFGNLCGINYRQRLGASKRKVNTSIGHRP